MRGFTALAFVAAAGLASSVEAAPPAGFSLGGVNLTAYCQSTYGQTYVSTLRGPTAGDWYCYRGGHHPGYPRPISVKDACWQQYGRSDLIAYAEQADPLSWRCYKPAGSPRAKPLGGVDLTAWCKSAYGQNLHAQLFGSTAGDWSCVINRPHPRPHDRRPISVQDACREQYDRTDLISWAYWPDPLSWRCYVPR